MTIDGPQVLALDQAAYEAVESAVQPDQRWYDPAYPFPNLAFRSSSWTLVLVLTLKESG